MIINNRRRKTQRSFTIWAEKEFWALLAKGLRTQRRLSKSQFIRDAIAYKMKIDFEINVPDELIVPLPPHTLDPSSAIKNNSPTAPIQYSVNTSKHYYVAEDPSSFGKDTK